MHSDDQPWWCRGGCGSVLVERAHSVTMLGSLQLSRVLTLGEGRRDVVVILHHGTITHVWGDTNTDITRVLGTVT